jgi:hypothetical protein
VAGCGAYEDKLNALPMLMAKVLHRYPREEVKIPLRVNNGHVVIARPIDRLIDWKF